MPGAKPRDLKLSRIQESRDRGSRRGHFVFLRPFVDYDCECLAADGVDRVFLCIRGSLRRLHSEAAICDCSTSATTGDADLISF